MPRVLVLLVVTQQYWSYFELVSPQQGVSPRVPPLTRLTRLNLTVVRGVCDLDWILLQSAMFVEQTASNAMLQSAVVRMTKNPCCSIREGM